MSIHKSLRSQGKLARARNVLTRAERIAILERRRVWREGDSVLGLVKVRVVKPKTGGKKKKKKKKEDED
jgi:small basic protein (TIGR04137 family)